MIESPAATHPLCEKLHELRRALHGAVLELAVLRIELDAHTATTSRIDRIEAQLERAAAVVDAIEDTR